MRWSRWGDASADHAVLLTHFLSTGEGMIEENKSQHPKALHLIKGKRAGFSESWLLKFNKK